jgi:hypothetical protein
LQKSLFFSSKKLISKTQSASLISTAGIYQREDVTYNWPDSSSLFREINKKFRGFTSKVLLITVSLVPVPVSIA